MLTRPRSILHDFLATEAAGGILLIGAAMLAMTVANSPMAPGFFHLLHLETGPVLSPQIGPMAVHLWINDGLMAVFFLLVGLEIKREFVGGHLLTWADRRLPFIAAVAGMVAPALVYLTVTHGNAELTRGWAIPAATDIAFALGLLALLGKRAPASLKLFLTTIAIVDDVGAVAIIALFYTTTLNWLALGAAAVVFGVMLAMNRAGVVRVRWYVMGFALLWYAMLLSGVHATVAGVLAAIAVPVAKGADDEHSPLHRLEHALQPWVAFAIVPLFGFANAGVSLGGAGAAFAPLPLGIALGLFVGKQIGVFGAVWVAAKTGIAARPVGASWAQVYGVSLLCGIGFTMSLFIGGLAFAAPEQADAVKIGVLIGSVASAVTGCGVLYFTGSVRR